MRHGHVKSSVQAGNGRSGQAWAFLALTWLLWIAVQGMAWANTAGGDPQQLLAKAETAAPRPAEGVPAEAAKKPADKAEADQVKPGVPAVAKPKAPAADAGMGDWPAWIKPSVQYRGRVEASRGILARTDYDGYYLNRIRLGATFEANPSLQAVVTIQDSQVLEYAVSPAPRNMSNTVDLRAGYVAFGTLKGGPLAVRAGRQDMSFGEGRILGSPDWGNTNRTYDAVRTSSVFPGVKVDTFAGAPVDIKQGGFDPRKPGESFYGAYASFDKLVPGVVEPFVIVRTTKSALSEAAVPGEAVLYTIGGRAAVKVAKLFDAAADVVVQRGDVAGDEISAWALHAAGVKALAGAWKPKVTAEYNFASGDRNAKDGKRQTFDQLYASNHARYGQGDLIGWRNMHHAGVAVEVTPRKPLKLTAGAHTFYLASLGDGLYGAAGSRTVWVKTATSRSIGWEADVSAAWTVSKSLNLGAGLATLFTGDYLKQGGAPDRFFVPYLFWNTKF